MTLDVDGKQTHLPDAATIAREFNSIGEDGLSLVTLSKTGKDSLCTSGTPEEGWGALLWEVDGATRAAELAMSLRQDKMIRIFQDYAKGDELWEKEFQWELMDSGKWPVKRIAMLIAFAVALIVIARLIGR